MVVLTTDALENPDHRTKLDLWKVNQVKRLQLLDAAANNSNLVRSVQALLKGGSVEQVPNPLVCKLRELIVRVLSHKE